MVRLNRKARGRGRRPYIVVVVHVLLIGITLRLARANPRIIPPPYRRCARRVRIAALAAAQLISAWGRRERIALADQTGEFQERI